MTLYLKINLAIGPHFLYRIGPKALGNNVSNLAHTYFLIVCTKTVHTLTMSLLKQKFGSRVIRRPLQRSELNFHRESTDLQHIYFLPDRVMMNLCSLSISGFQHDHVYRTHTQMHVRTNYKQSNNQV